MHLNNIFRQNLLKLMGEMIKNQMFFSKFAANKEKCCNKAEHDQ